MLNQSGITKVTGGAPVQILFDAQNKVAVGVVVSSAVTSVTENGRKIVKAGTPLAGNLEARETAFTLATTTTVSGVLLHDVDVTNGNANGTLLIFGFVNTDRLSAGVKTLLVADVKTGLDKKITFLK